MMRRAAPQRVIGIALGERSIRFTEMKRTGQSVEVVATSRMSLDTSIDQIEPDELGSAIGAHLKAHGHKARHAALGLSTRWVLVHRESAPPADAATLRSIIRLKIEKRFSAAEQDLTFSFQDAAAQNSQHGLLLVGAQTERIQRLHKATVAAGLVPISMVASALAAVATSQANGIVVLIDPDGASLLTIEQGRCAGLASSPVTEQGLATDAGRVRFVADLARHLVASANDRCDVLLLDALEQSDESRLTLRQTIAERFGNCEARPIDEAELLARGALSGDQAIADLLSSRLDVAPPRRLSARLTWLLRGAVAALVVTAILGFIWTRAAQRLESLQRQYAAVQPNAERLENLRLDMRAVVGWFDERPAVLDCLLELTHTIPRRGRIWVTSLHLDENLRGTIKCKADDKDLMHSYLNAMQASRHLADVELRDWNQSGSKSRIVDFEITFVHRSDVGGAD